MELSEAYLAESQAPVLYGVALGFISFTGILVALRMYTRLVVLRIPGADDWSILAAFAVALVLSVTTCMEAVYGMGRHKEAVTLEQTPNQLKYLMICILHYNLGMNVVKVSFLFQFRRIFEDSRIQKICFWAIGYVIVWAAVQLVLLGVACLPISFLVPSATDWCLDTLPIWYFSSAMSLATDCLIFLIPLPSVIKLKLPTKQKIMVVLIFCLGFFVCIISVYRISTLKAAVESQDPPWDNVGAAIWSVIELNCAIICACLPTLRPLLAGIVPGMSSNHSQGNTYERYGDYKGSKGDGFGSYGGRSRSNTGFKGSQNSPTSISEEELALHTMPSAYVQSDRRGYAAGLHRENSKHIMVTRETVVR